MVSVPKAIALGNVLVFYPVEGNRSSIMSRGTAR